MLIYTYVLLLNKIDPISSCQFAVYFGKIPKHKIGGYFPLSGAKV